MSFTLPMKASKHCRHYSYNLRDLGDGRGPRCGLGKDLTDPVATRPCMPEPNAACDGREEYTDAERAAWRAAVDARMARLGNAVQALPRAIPLNTQGSIACPNCDGRLHYARWHRGAQIACTTEHCCGAHFSIEAGKDWPAHEPKEPA